ncbi:AAA family ATPase [Candidatus Gracilibacteria bacterium]|nr:MAG: AAA family ATPase [Candidatus Gracilibacteria bacterium]
MRKYFLKTIYFQKLNDKDDFRGKIDIFKNLEKLDFEKNITYFVGENGSGKSTLLENIALEFGLNQEGGTKGANYKTSLSDKTNKNWLKLSWEVTKFKYGYFFRAEGIYNFVNYLENLDGGFKPYGGENLHLMSHGEQFIQILESISGTKGFFIIDEIESAISPANQLKIKSLIEKMAENGSQFIIATHSPIILSIPNSQILNFDFGKIQETEFDMAPCVDIYKRFFKKII